MASPAQLDGSDGDGLYRWECPICGRERNGLAGDTTAATNRLRSHIRSSVGDGHGPHNVCPDDLGDLSRYIESLNARL